MTVLAMVVFATAMGIVVAFISAVTAMFFLIADFLIATIAVAGTAITCTVLMLCNCAYFIVADTGVDICPGGAR